mmetsp:Transcript_8179/g.18573  ORF Transcript_8179/g.18573 Transcript_8179/m.18573 type:complete len:204 (-) Transcript_8179:598-1209(-)
MYKFAPSTMSGQHGTLRSLPSSARWKKPPTLSALIVPGLPPAGKNASARTLRGKVLRRRTPSGLLSVRTSTPVGDNAFVSYSASGRPELTRRSNSLQERPLGSSATAVPSHMPTTLQPSSPRYMRCSTFSAFPATSPEGPPLSLTVKGRPVSLGCSPQRRSAMSRNTATPSLVTPYVLWLIPAFALLDMKDAGDGWPRRLASL